MLCPSCRAACSEDDLYCRQCGKDLTVPSTSLVPINSHLPAVLHNPQLPRLAAGVGALAFGVGIELLRRSLLARVTRPSRSVSHALPALGGIHDLLTPADEKSLKLPKGYEVQETLVYMRRVIRRQQ